MDSQPARSALWAAANLPQWVRLTRDSAYLAGSTGVSLLAKLGLALTFAHLSTPAIYGQYRYLTTVLGVMTLTVLPGMTAAVIRASARGYDRTLEHAARARVPVSLVGSFVLLALAALYLVRGETVFGRALAVAALCFPLLASFDLYLPFLSGKGDFRRYALFQGLVKAAPIPVMVVVLIAGGRLEAIVLAWLAVTIGLHGLFFRETLRSAHPASEVDKEGLLYGRRVSVAYVISTGQTHLASLVAGALLGPVHLAVLSIGLVWWEVFRQATSLVSLQVPCWERRSRRG
ncbi:MAG: lipopolysaccharide biosynthesis protein [Armatimonadota bacterium]